MLVGIKQEETTGGTSRTKIRRSFFFKQGFWGGLLWINKEQYTTER